MRHAVGYTRRFWDRVTEPKAITLGQTLIYSLMSFAGASALIEPPRTVSEAWGSLLTIVWGLFLVLGGVVGAITCIFGKWWLEKPALLSVAVGALMYASVVLALHFSDPGNRLAQLAFVLSSVVQCGIRFLHIHRYSYEPGK